MAIALNNDLTLKAINPKENFLGRSWTLEVNRISEEAGLKTQKSCFCPCKSIVIVFLSENTLMQRLRIYKQEMGELQKILEEVVIHNIIFSDSAILKPCSEAIWWVNWRKNYVTHSCPGFKLTTILFHGSVIKNSIRTVMFQQALQW